MIHWLGSYPKSGSTWARLLLTAYHRDGHVHINDTIVIGDVVEHHYQAASLRPVPKLSGQEKILLRYAAMMNLIHSVRYRPLVVKTHHANTEMWGVRMLPPALSQRSVYIVRDPRDVAPSFARHMGKPHDEIVGLMNDEHYSIGDEGRVPHILSSWSNHVRSWGAGDPEVTLVRYEDMCADPGDALERMLLTFNVNPDPARIARAVEACELARLQEQEDGKGFVEASERAGQFFGGTKERLSAEHVAQIECDHGEMMEKLGYTSKARDVA